MTLDTTYQGQDFPSNMAALTTDYRYDNLYRLVQVKTPEGKNIYYNYDGYGVEVDTSTPDAGYTYYSYDENGNLILSQDENQKSIASNLNTRRVYDGLNRLLTISDYKVYNIDPNINGPMGDTLLPSLFDTPPSSDSTYVVNVYDTISTAVVGIFNNLPADYSSAPNYTRGNLVATAYRTLLSDAWGFKFYRYDERGNVTKLWHYIAGVWMEIRDILSQQPEPAYKGTGTSQTRPMASFSHTAMTEPEGLIMLTSIWALHPMIQKKKVKLTAVRLTSPYKICLQ